MSSIKQFINNVDQYKKQLTLPTLDQSVKLDDVDRLLLSLSQVDLNFQDKHFGGAVNINAKTFRSNLSLFAK